MPRWGKTFGSLRGRTRWFFSPGSTLPTCPSRFKAVTGTSSGERVIVELHPPQRVVSGTSSCTISPGAASPDRLPLVIEDADRSGGGSGSGGLSFVPDSLRVVGQEPDRLYERDAEQIIRLDFSYVADAGHVGGVSFGVVVRPLGSSPATLVGPGLCATERLGPAGDVSVSDRRWIEGGGPTGQTSQANPAGDGNEQPEPRTFRAGFSLGLLCQDSETEPVEQFVVSLYVESDSGRSVTIERVVRIIDDDGGHGGVVEITPTAFTVTETDEDFAPALELSFSETFRLSLVLPLPSSCRFGGVGRRAG